MQFTRANARHIRRRLGSIMVLVVAVLALLAVIGTVYIVSARTERGTARDMQATYNLDLARQAALKAVSSIIGDSTTDAAGNPGGSIVAGPFGISTARRWTIREVGTTPGKCFYNGFYRDQAWLVSDLYRPVAMPVPLVAADLSFLTPNLFDPQTGQYDIPYPLYPVDGILTNAVSDYYPAGLPQPKPFPDAVMHADAYFNLLPFSEASGVRYRFAVRILDTSRMANLNVGAPLLVGGSYPDQQGTYFTSYSLCVTDASNPNSTIFDATTPGSMNSGVVDQPLALDTIQPANVPPFPGRRGNLPTPAFPYADGTDYVYAWSKVALSFETSNYAAAPFDLADELELRSYGDIGTAFQARPAMFSGIASLNMWPNTLGNTIISGPSAGAVVGNIRREFYTAYSYSRELALIPGTFYAAVPEYTLTGLSIAPTNNVWPAFPARVAANPDVRTGVYAPGGAADYLAIAATNIAHAMEICGFNAAYPAYKHEEACAFAANYITYRWNSWQLSANGWSMPNGPSFVDEQGICVRGDGGLTRDYGGAGTNDLKAETGKVYVGYAAQPFITEIALTAATTPDAANPGSFIVQIADSAVELYNPYSYPLDLSDYKLRITDKTSGAVQDILLGAAAGKKPSIPAHGCYVITTPAGPNNLSGQVAAATPQDQTTGANFPLSKEGGTVELMRKWTPRAPFAAPSAPNTAWYVAIDQYDYSPISDQAKTPDTAPSNKDWYVRRPSDPSGWSETVSDPTSATAQGPNASATPAADPPAAPVGEMMTLGGINPAASGTVTVVPLYDRTIGFPTNQRASLTNIGDFNHIMRLCSEVVAPSGSAFDLDSVTGMTIPVQLQSKITTPDAQVAATQCPIDASIRFDFRSAPWIYSGSHDPAVPVATPASLPADNPTLEAAALAVIPPPGMPSAPKHGDIRAAYLLEDLAFVDRVSDLTVDLGDNNSLPPGTGQGLSKLRIPGQINVNTAPAEVLGTIPILASHPAWVGAIMAYRFRTISTDARIPPYYRAPQNAAVGAAATYDFSQPDAYPGYGVRSLGELQIPLSTDAGYATATSFELRDPVWASVYNYCTVRSDTFIVYGYLEAVRQNTQYDGSAGVFNNGTDWYGTGPAVTDDPRAPKAKLVRVARRRFVAIIDSSNCNYPRSDTRFAFPRIVAIKDLPN